MIVEAIKLKMMCAQSLCVTAMSTRYEKLIASDGAPPI